MLGTLRFAHRTAVTMDRDEFLTAALRNPVNEIIAEELFRLALPDAWLVSGCLVQTAWNVLTNRAVDHGINDYDVFYFDADTSWEAEDNVIRALASVLQNAASRSRRATRRGSISGIPKNMACPIRSCVLDPRHRPLPDQKYADRNPAHGRWLRGVRAEWL